VVDANGELTLAEVQKEFPAWHCCKSVNGLYYAQQEGASPPVTVRGEDPMDLRDGIRAAIGRALA
jgi:hypothetical protein